MIFATQANADSRSLVSAALLGSGLGLGLGAAYLAILAGQTGDDTRAARISAAATHGYESSRLEAGGSDLRTGLVRYGFQPGADARAVSARFANDRGAGSTRVRADLECLTGAVYYEARGESPQGQHAVAQVVMNRVKHPAYPKSVCAVVYQGAGRSGCQFSFACDGSTRRGREAKAWARARKVAARVLAGGTVANIGYATHFHTTAVSPFWAPQMLRVAQVGAHVFYKFSPYRLRHPLPAPAPEAVLISGEVDAVPTLTITPVSVEQAVEATLQPTTEATVAKPVPSTASSAPPAPTGAASDAVALAAPATGTAAAS